MITLLELPPKNCITVYCDEVGRESFFKPICQNFIYSNLFPLSSNIQNSNT